MTPPEVHFLTLTLLGPRRGWVAPLELPKGNQQGATHVVPVSLGGGLFSQYRLECARCSAGGGYALEWVVADLHRSGFLETSIAGWRIRFQRRLEAGQPVRFDYVGSLVHPDFAFPLAEIVPEDEGQLADLYARERIVIVGCDPLTRYEGAEAILHPSSPRPVPP